MPLVFLRATLDIFNLVKLWVAWALGLTAAWLWLAGSLERRIWMPRFPIVYSAAAFLGAYALSSVFSQNRTISLLGVYHRYGGIVPAALYVVIMFLVVGLYWERPERLRGLAVTLALALVAMSIYILVQEAGLDPIDWRMPDGSRPGAPVGTMGNSNFAGGYLAVSLPFVVYLAVHSASRISPWILLSLIFNSFALWLTGSRGAMIGGAAGLGFSAYLYRERLKPWMKRTAAAALVSGMVLAVFILWRPGFDRPPEALGRLHVFRTDTLRLRQFYWGTALRIFLDHPWVGTGPDTFYSNYGRYRALEDGQTMGLGVADKPHNIYLEYAANSGILGLGTYVTLAGLALVYAARQGRREDYPHRGLAVAFSSAYVAYLTQGFLSIDVPPLALLGWICLGGIAVTSDPRILAARAKLEAARRSVEEEGRASTGPEPAPGRGGGTTGSWRGSSGARRAVQSATGLAALGLVFVGSRPLLADIHAKTAQIQAAAPSFERNEAIERGIGKLESAIRLHPIEAQYLRDAGRLYQMRGSRSSGASDKERSYRQALGRLLRAHRLEPANVFIGMDLANLETRWAAELDKRRFGEADRWWKKTVAMDPTNWELRFRHGEFLSQWGASTGDVGVLQRARAKLEAVARIRPDKPNVWVSLARSNISLGNNQAAREALGRAQQLAPDDPVVEGLLVKLQE